MRICQFIETNNTFRNLLGLIKKNIHILYQYLKNNQKLKVIKGHRPMFVIRKIYEICLCTFWEYQIFSTRVLNLIVIVD